MSTAVGMNGLRCDGSLQIGIQGTLGEFLKYSWRKIKGR